ncbi:uncharacterized protein [Drosophila kikkawai]|uniref:RNA-directed DNA polymerase n=1 Tax=Drosophila kikkawai TaxID=30033 RepID=A0ABM4GBB0_DROKI
MKDLSGRLARWSLRLQGIDFEISHRKGADNVLADTLSRCARLPDVRVEGDLIFKRLGFGRLEDEVEGGPWKLWIPASLTAGMIATAHKEPTSGHGGVKKTLQKLQRQYYWPGMTTQVRDFVGRCTMKEATATSVVEFLVHEVFFKFGVPEVIHSDNAQWFGLYGAAAIITSRCAIAMKLSPKI